MRNRLAALSGVVLMLAGCNSETMAPAYIGIPGAGVKAQIISLVSESDGFLVKVSVKNLDTVQLGYNVPCPWQAEKLTDNQWVRVGGPVGQCAGSEALLAPGQDYPSTYEFKSTGLVVGDQLRIVTDGHATASITIQ